MTLMAHLDEQLLQQYMRVRKQTRDLASGLSVEDMLLQSMPDASPTKWHLAHTTWFFETFLLQPHVSNYQTFNTAFQYLFNSYYETVGERHPRPQRGLLSRPPLSEVLAYREHVDAGMAELLRGLNGLDSDAAAEIADAVTIGLHHEMQHQELIQTDSKHALSLNPCALTLADDLSSSPVEQPPEAKFVSFEGGLFELGTNAESGFAYDCEQPRHNVFVPEFSLCERLVTNAEWLAFMKDGGYQRPEFWLSDGWATAQQEKWQAPLYWYQERYQERHEEENGGWLTMTNQQRQPINWQAPVCHISYFEADAFARWRKCRLPTEAEWEFAAQNVPIKGNFLEAGHQLPQPASADAKGLQQLFGDAWEWTQSPFTPYPGFQPPGGALAEYNGKFMANQWVLRGGSCATAQQQLRTTYRNFFYAHQRWQFTSLRLAH